MTAAPFSLNVTHWGGAFDENLQIGAGFCLSDKGVKLLRTQSTVKVFRLGVAAQDRVAVDHHLTFRGQQPQRGADQGGFACVRVMGRGLCHGGCGLGRAIAQIA